MTDVRLAELLGTTYQNLQSTYKRGDLFKKRLQYHIFKSSFERIELLVGEDQLTEMIADENLEGLIRLLKADVKASDDMTVIRDALSRILEDHAS